MFGQDVSVKVTSYYPSFPFGTGAGGSYELDQSGVVQAGGGILVSAATNLKYYSLADAAVAMTTCTSGTCAALSYFITDNLGSVDAVTDASGGRLP